jgi:hypothetical protein
MVAPADKQSGATTNAVELAQTMPPFLAAAELDLAELLQQEAMVALMGPTLWLAALVDPVSATASRERQPATAAVVAVDHGARLVVVQAEQVAAALARQVHPERQTPVVVAAAEPQVVLQAVQAAQVSRSSDMQMFLPLQRSPQTSRKVVHSRIRSR